MADGNKKDQGNDFLAGAPQSAEPPSAPSEIRPGPPPQEEPQEEVANQTVATPPTGPDSWLPRLDVLFLVLGLVLAFLLGSFFVSQNSDVFLHLAAGRDLLQGSYTLGVDPYAHNTEGVPWINHAWVFDVALFWLHGAAGGTGLIVAKGMLTVLLTWLLMRIRRPDQGFFLPGVCAVLGVLTLSTRLWVQPMLMSFLLLAILLGWLLKAPTRRLLWQVPLLTVLWVNVDAWWILAPLVLMLAILGHTLQRWLGGEGKPGLLAAVLGLTLVASLVNPYAYRAWQLPPDLAYVLLALGDFWPAGLVDGGRTLDELNRQVRVINLNLSPVSMDYWEQRSFASVAYYALLGLSLISFVLAVLEAPAQTRVFNGPRLFFWMFFTGLSLWQVRFIPWFAVVITPITALNLQDAATWRFAPERGGFDRRSARAVRVLAMVMVLALGLLAWPGWLHSGPDNPRTSHRVAWALPVDPGLEIMGARVKELHAAGVVTNAFNVGPEGGQVLAYFAGPEVKDSFDQRYALFAEVASANAKARQALLNDSIAYFGGKRAEGGWTRDDLYKAWREWKIDHLVFTNAQADRDTNLVVQRLWADPVRFPPLYIDGRTAVFGWRDPERKDDLFAGKQINLRGAVFGQIPEDQRLAPDGTPPAATQGFFDQYLHGSGPFPWPTAEAQLDVVLLHLQSLPRWQQPWARANVIATHAPVPGTLPVSNLINYPGTTFGKPPLVIPFLRGRDFAPPELALGAVRAARRGVTENPTSVDAYRQQGSSYGVLGRVVENYWLGHTNPFPSVNRHGSRASLRHVQQLAALQNASRVKPHDVEVHEILFQLFQQNNYVDLALDHLDQALEYLPKQNLPAAKAAEIAKQLKERRNLVAEEVERRRKGYQVMLDNHKLQTGKEMPLVGRVNLALSGTADQKQPFGLAKLALQLLADQSEEEMKNLKVEEQAANLYFQIHLLLLQGRVGEVRELLYLNASNREPNEAIKKALPTGAFDLFEAETAAALGDYATADKALAAGEKMVAIDKQMKQIKHWREMQESVQRLLLVGMLPKLPIGMQTQPLPAVRFSVTLELLPDTDSILRQHIGAVQRGLELRMLRGLLALEQGDNDAALTHFRSCLRTEEGVYNFPDRLVAERYLELLEEQRK